MKCFMLVFLCAIFLVCNANAQGEKRIEGKVTDLQNVPLPNVTVKEKNTNKVVITNKDGSFQINVFEQNAMLVFSAIGFLSQEVSVGASTKISVQMVTEVQALSDVVVVGFATQRKVNLTGSVATVKGADISKQSALQASTALQGLAPGVNISRSGGSPGSGSSIRIRGIGSIGGDSKSDPLIIVDGVPFENIDNINPSDIDNLSVLKDAASASIYGSRAANGVILVTTKRAGNAFDVNYNTSISFQKPTLLPKYVDGFQYIDFFNAANVNEGKAPVYPQSFVESYRAQGNANLYPNTDWNDVMYKNAMQQNHFASVSGGSDKAKIFASMGYMSQGGTMDNSNFDKITFRVNSSLKASEKLNFAFDIAGEKSKYLSPTYSANSASQDILFTPPIFTPKYTDGRWGATSNGKNPKALVAEGGTTNQKVDELVLNFTGTYKPIKNLTLSANVSSRHTFDNSDAFTDTVGLFDFAALQPTYIRPVGVTVSSLTSSMINTSNLLFKALASYNATIAERHDITVLVGSEQIKNDVKLMSAFSDNFLLSDFQVINAGSSANQKATGNTLAYSLSSFFGRLNYNFDNKYLLEGNLRYDGSSRLSPGKKWDIFPSVSAGWRISQEKFLSGSSAWLSNLKLRASWGMLGNQNIGLYPFVSSVNLNQFTILGNSRTDGAALLQLANQDIGWEKTEMSNIGLDVGLFDGKLTIEGDYFIKNTRDILLTLPIPLTLGLSAPVQNAGKLRNYGYEINVNYRNKLNQLGYTVGVNFSDVANKVLDLKGSGPYISGNTIIKEGYPINSLYIFRANGLFQTGDNLASYPTQIGIYGPGDIRYLDFSGPAGVPDGKISAEDRQVIGNNYPRYTVAANLSLDYQGFDFSVFVQGVLGVKRMLSDYAATAFFQFATPQQWMLDSWTPQNPGASYPRYVSTYTNNIQPSTFFVRSASYLRLKNIQLGYTFPKSLLNKTFIKGCRLFVSGQDILTLSGYFPGWDPENNSSTNSFYPLVSSYNLGLNIKF